MASTVANDIDTMCCNFRQKETRSRGGLRGIAGGAKGGGSDSSPYGPVALLDPSVPLDGSIRSTQAVLHKARVSGIRRRRLGKKWGYECVRVCVWVPDRRLANKRVRVG